jgi:outer membrane lipoprotein-sorting protein
MVKKIFFVFIFFAVSFFLIADEKQDYKKLLETVDDLVSFKETDLAAEYTIEKRDPGGAISTTVAIMFRRDRTDQFLILISEPVVDKGKGYLKTGDNLWLYDPVSNASTFTSAKERFQNSSARNSDFNRSNYSNDYEVITGHKEKLGKFNCTVLDLKAISNSVSFPKIKIWISEDNLVRQIEDYSLSGQLMRKTAIPTYQKTGNRWLPASLTIMDYLVFAKINNKIEYERTKITIKNPSLKPLPDITYTKEYLERVRN